MARTALADAGVEDSGEDFVSAGHFDGVVVDELDRSAEATDESYGLGFGDLVSRHSRCCMETTSIGCELHVLRVVEEVLHVDRGETAVLISPHKSYDTLTWYRYMQVTCTISSKLVIVLSVSLLSGVLERGSSRTRQDFCCLAAWSTVFRFRYLQRRNVASDPAFCCEDVRKYGEKL